VICTQGTEKAEQYICGAGLYKKLLFYLIFYLTPAVQENGHGSTVNEP
jgi:hypothetical protein